MWQPLVTLAALPAIALAAFAREDVQLFELRDEIVKDLGEKVDFYSWLGVKKGASAKEIMKSFRKISRRLHPDRNPGQEATDRFARLNQVYKILRSPMRDRYDHYLSKGFPAFDAASGEWKLHHFRPNIVLTLILIALIVSFIHFLILKANAHSRRSHLAGIAEDARREAAKSSTTGVLTSPVRVQHGNNEFTVHPTGEVYFQSVKVDPSAIEEPTWEDTVFVRLFRKAQNAQSKTNSVEESAVPVAVEEEQEQEVEIAKTSSSTSSSKEPEVLKKGASRRRPAGARGKAKIF